MRKEYLLLCLKWKYLKDERDSLQRIAETILAEELSAEEDVIEEVTSEDSASVSTKSDSDYEVQEEKESSPFDNESGDEDSSKSSKEDRAPSRTAKGKPVNEIVTRSKTRKTILANMKKEASTAPSQTEKAEEKVDIRDWVSR